MEDVISEIRSLLKDPAKFDKFASERFEHTDVDKNGVIDREELESAMIEIAEEMGVAKPKKSTVEKVLKKYDADKSGKLDREEFFEFTKWVLDNFIKAIEENS